MVEYFQLLASDYTLQTITLGTTVMGIICGILGSFAVLRQQSLLGDAISHAALPGIAIAFLLLGVKDPLLFFVGAIISGILGTMWMRGITERTRLKTDTAQGIILSVFFGFGILLLSIIQKMPNANQAGLDTFLFGQAATIIAKDVAIMMIIGIIAIITVTLFWKEFKLLSFDPQYAKTLGFNIRLLDIVLTSLIVIAIVLGLQTVGVVLMSAMLLAPAAAARQWTDRLIIMVLLSALFGAMASIVGTGISATAARVSTGPVIVLVATVIVMISFIFAPSRGLLFKHLRYLQNRRNLRKDKTLSLMYELASTHEDFQHPHAIRILNNLQGFHPKSMKSLEEEELIKVQKNHWILTPKGFQYAKELYNQINID